MTLLILSCLIFEDEMEANTGIFIKDEFILNLWGQKGNGYAFSSIPVMINVNSATKATGKMNWISLNLCDTDNERVKTGYDKFRH